MEYDGITSVEKLRDLYGEPMGLAVKKEMSNLDRYSLHFLEMSAFSILATSDASGQLDCSPRGDYPGFIQHLDDFTIALPDRPGNNRLDSLCNIVENPNVGILALIPGFKECLRINGTAKIVTNSDLLSRFEYKGKLPKSVIVVSIKAVYFHCAKAITRAQLWEPESWFDRDNMPGFGQILMSQIDPSTSAADVQKVEELIENRLQNTLY